MSEYFRREEIAASHPDVITEWNEWLRDNFDLGHYDMILRGLDMLIAHRQPQARMRWYPRSSGGSQTEILSLGLPDRTRS